MTEQDTTAQQQPELPAPPPSENPPAPTPSEDIKAKPDPTGSGRYCVYDLTLTQYVGPVVDKKPTTADAKKLVRKGHKFEVREV